MQLRTADIRKTFVRLLAEEKFTQINRESSMTGLVGNTTIEILGANFIADEDSIFGEVNWDYVKREEEWYNSQSLNVNDIPGGAPAIWKAVADKDGFINSNYGHLIYSPENGFKKPAASGSSMREAETDGWMSQYKCTLQELTQSPSSRRACMIYTRPQIWLDYNKNGRSDFICTNVVQYLIRDGKVHAVVQMRSNDAVFGYKNDKVWQQHVLEKLTSDLNAAGNNYEVGDLIWNVGSLHVYARHYNLVDPVKYAK
jgi:thymidylate synthase